jgi:hypothetical protein
MGQIKGEWKMSIKEIQSMEIDQRIDIGNFFVKRKSKKTYCLFDKRNNHRSRWGTAVEIHNDLCHCAEYDKLPGGKNAFF